MRAAALLVVATICALAVGTPVAHAAEGKPEFYAFIFPLDTEPGVAGSYFWMIENFGDADAGAFDVEVRIDGALVDAWRIEAAPVFQFLEGERAHAALAPGLHTFELTLDTADEIAEENEADNVFAMTVTFSTDRPDLEMEIVEIAHTGWPEGEVAIDWRVCNIGTHATLAPVYVRGFLRGGLPIVQRTTFSVGPGYVDVLDAGACIEGTSSAHTGANFGEHVVEMWAYAWEPTPYERHYENNRVVRTVDLTPGVGI